MSAPIRISLTHPITITPEMATKWLLESHGKGKSNGGQKRIAEMASRLRVGSYLPDELRFRFVDNRLADGRRRMSAIVQAGVSVEGYVEFV